MVVETFESKLLRSRLGKVRAHHSIKPLYSDHGWVRDLDIVNELGGHTGCVNALSWAKGGGLLASGSDDTYLNIWSYNPDSLAQPFTLSTSVSTGHTENIFSVKFMPHSNDNTVITCAGDSEVRVFDLEYSGAAGLSSATEGTRSRRFQQFFKNARWLNEGNTNARVYRSHANRAKRIVTESSPYLFLSCAEDGEVRQWDLRQPSSAYPPPRNGRYGYRRRPREEESDNIPPALISYSRYGIDLNSISCSGTQPHYIALGGAHLHCFLHDRRMLGRDLATERGIPIGKSPTPGSTADEEMRENTRCVKRFAPDNKRRMKPGERGHITACKISDARPNELISSWSGDHIYSFDIVQSPDAREKADRADAEALRRHEQKKRRRAEAASSTTSTGAANNDRKKLRRAPTGASEAGSTTIGDQSIPDAGDREMSTQPPSLGSVTSSSRRIAQALDTLQKTLLDFSTFLKETSAQAEAQVPEISPQHVYKSTYDQAATLLPEMDQVMREWTYPVTEDEEEIMRENQLRRTRQSAWRFAQAAGVVARVQGGTDSETNERSLPYFPVIQPAAMERNKIDDSEKFYYDFAKAILSWIQGGQAGLGTSFIRPRDLHGGSERFPVNDIDSAEEAVEKLKSYLSAIADEQVPIFDIDKNKFERDELRQIFPNQTTAVRAFFSFVTRSAQVDGFSAEQLSLLKEDGATKRFWIDRVVRSLLQSASADLTVDCVEEAFDNTGRNSLDIRPDVVEIEQIEIGPDDIEQEFDDDGPDYSEEEEENSDSEPDYDPMPRPYRSSSRNATHRANCNSHVSYVSHTKVYQGHNNTRTVKDVNYYGLDDEYVVSGSDDGHFFIWDRKTSKIVYVGKGDGEVVNVIQGHPYEPMLAVSGIDSTVKIFGVSGERSVDGPSRERHAAMLGQGIANPSGTQHSSVRGWGRRRFRGMADEEGEEESAAPLVPGAPGDENATELKVDSEGYAKGGLRSRKVPAKKIYEITSNNNAERIRGETGGGAFIPQAILARLIQTGQFQNMGGQIDEDGTIRIDENCPFM